jgi:hypothetical protein
MPGHGKVQVQGTSENWWSRVVRDYGLVRGSSRTERRKPGTAVETLNIRISGQGTPDTDLEKTSADNPSRVAEESHGYLLPDHPRAHPYLVTGVTGWRLSSPKFRIP